MGKLPSLPYSGRYETSAQTVFAGLNANPGATDGEIVEMQNLTGEYYPVLSTRKPRGTLRSTLHPRTLWAEDDLVEVYGSGDGDTATLTINNTHSYTVSDSPKQIARLLNRLIIFPDKKIISLDDWTIKDMGSSVAFGGVTFQGGIIFGEKADANTIYKIGADWDQYFSPGDAVKIDGATVHPENNQTIIVREIDGDYLRFYENSFVLDPTWSYSVDRVGLRGGVHYWFKAGVDNIGFECPYELSYGQATFYWDGTTLKLKLADRTETVSSDLLDTGPQLYFVEGDRLGPYTETGTLTFSRDIPDLDYIFASNNRLWGCKGDSIWASKLGDPTNFYVFDGLSTDSWTVDVGDKGDFTAAIAYQGYPTFFKEQSIIKVFGDRPSNYQTTESATRGVAYESSLSVVPVSDVLYYLSPDGVAAYSGGIPQVISQPLGVEKRFQNAVAGTDGHRYYVSMSWKDVENHTQHGLFVYDTMRGMWHQEDDTEAVGFGFWRGALYMLTRWYPFIMPEETGDLIDISGATGTSEIQSGTELEWKAVFADATETVPEKKGVLRLLVRYETIGPCDISFFVRYDTETWRDAIIARGAARHVHHTDASGKQSYVVPLVVRRCDHWQLEIAGFGQVRIYSIAKTRYIGSEKQNL